MTFITRQMLIDQLVELDAKCEAAFNDACVNDEAEKTAIEQACGNDGAAEAAIESYFFVTHNMPDFDEVSDPYSPGVQYFSDEEQALITKIDDKWDNRLYVREERLHMDLAFGLCTIIPAEADGNSVLHKSELVLG